MKPVSTTQRGEVLGVCLELFFFFLSKAEMFKGVVSFFFLRFIFYLFIYFWPRWVFVLAHRLPLVVALGSCSSWQRMGSRHSGSVVVTHGLSCPTARGILVPGPGIETVSLALAGGLPTTGVPGKLQRAVLYPENFPSYVYRCPT